MSRFRNRVVFLLALTAAALSFKPAVQAKPDFPTPSPYPISWELKFEHGTPHRISVDVTDQAIPRAYWYMTYTVTNESDKEQKFYPQTDLMTADGKIHKSDEKVPKKAFDEIRLATHNKFLEPYTSISGPIRLGPAEARDGVAVWAETLPRMEHFSIFITGLSGEAIIYKTVDGKLVKAEAAEDMYSKDNEDELLKKGLTIMRKTLQLNYYIRGDEVFPGEDEVTKANENEIVGKLTAQIDKDETEIANLDKLIEKLNPAVEADAAKIKQLNDSKGNLQYKLDDLRHSLASTKIESEEWIMR